MPGWVWFAAGLVVAPAGAAVWAVWHFVRGDWWPG